MAFVALILHSELVDNLFFSELLPAARRKQVGESEFEIFTRVSGNMLDCGMVRCSEQRCLVQDKRNKNRFGACDVIHD